MKFLNIEPWRSGQNQEFLLQTGQSEFDPYHFGDVEYVKWSAPADLEVGFRLFEVRDVRTSRATVCDVRLRLIFGGVRKLRIEQDEAYAPEFASEVDYYFNFHIDDAGVGQFDEFAVAGLEMQFQCTEVQLVIADAPAA